MQLIPTPSPPPLPSSPAGDGSSPAVIAGDFAQTVVTWLALDSMAPYWRAAWPALAPHLDTLRDSARLALWRRHQQGARGALAALMVDALPPPVRAETLVVFDHILALHDNAGAGDWASWFGQNQHTPEALGIADPMRAQLLVNRYRAEVVRPARALRDGIEAAIPLAPMDDWDIWVHTVYGYTYHSTDRWPDSVILTAAAGLYRDALTNRFLREAVMPLPAADRAALLAAIRAEAGLTLDGVVEGGNEAAIAMLVPGGDVAGTIAAIRPVEEVIVP